MSATVVCACGWTGDYQRRAQAEFNARRHVCKDARRGTVRRATRHYRCKRCGLEATYENAGAAEARSWFSRHSCRRHEEAMLRAAFGRERMAAVDRTPKPCLHKQANHAHGTRACYVLDRCRCRPCSKANSAAEVERQRLKAYGRYHKLVDAYPVRLHLAELAEYGIGLKQVARLSGVSQGALWKLVYGRKRPDGSQTPSLRVHRHVAERIYEIEPVPENLGAGQVDPERTPLARLHLRSLVALGWSMHQLGLRLGVKPGNMSALVGTEPGRQRLLTRGTVDRIEALFDELCMTVPPQTNHRERQSASRARNYARARRWRTPLMLDDVDVDESDTSQTPPTTHDQEAA